MDEAQSAESGGGVLREGAASCKLPSGTWGTVLAAKMFSCILEASDSLSWNLLGSKFGWGHGSLGPP